MKFQGDCLDCKHCVFDPDCGNDCSLEHYNYFHRKYWECPDFVFDEEYVREEFEKMIRRLASRRPKEEK